MTALRIPPATIEKLKHPAPPGERHPQILEISCSLAAQGFNGEAIFQQLRPGYGPDVSDKEIRDIITWADRKFAGAKNSHYQVSRRDSSVRKYFPWKKENPPAKSPIENVKSYLEGFSCSEADIFDASPVKLPGNYQEDCIFLFENLYSPEDQINIVTNFWTETDEDGRQKAGPEGYGITKPRNRWMEYLRINPAPQSDAGAWLRINPTDGKGISEENVTDFRFVLLESDILPLDIQYSLLAKLPLPISAILTSGGKSLHAWVKIAENSASEYRSKVDKLFPVLSKLGFDPATRNSGRLSRLPGVRRKIGAVHTGIQKLIYLNHSPSYLSIL